MYEQLLYKKVQKRCLNEVLNSRRENNIVSKSILAALGYRGSCHNSTYGHGSIFSRLSWNIRHWRNDPISRLLLEISFDTIFLLGRSRKAITFWERAILNSLLRVFVYSLNIEKSYKTGDGNSITITILIILITILR